MAGVQTKRGNTRIFCESFLLRSGFERLVQGHLKVLNHLTFSLLLYFRESGVRLSQGIESCVSPRFSAFASLALSQGIESS